MRFHIFSSILILGIMALGPAAQPAEAATGPGTQPKESWDKMQTFEYNIGRIAGGLELCRRYDMSREIQAIADLTPYGKLGMAKMRVFDGMRGCGGLAENAKSVLGDKEKLIEYMKIRYDCSSGDCVER